MVLAVQRRRGHPAVLRRRRPVLENLHRLALFTAVTSTFGWDTGRAITTAVAIVLAGPAVLAALRRAVRRAAFGAPVTFATACDPPTPRADGDDVTTPGVPLSSSRQDGDVVTGHALGSAADQAEFGGGGDGRGA